MPPNPALSVLFVCMGNICRSPTAEGVFRQRVAAADLAHAVITDSAGTHAYHIGDPPDRRSQAHATRRGYNLSALRARQVCAEDFERFDHVLAMDHDNLARLQAACPPQHRHKLGLFMQYARNSQADIVPDPYYGGSGGFDLVLDYIEDAADGLLERLQESLKTARTAG